jgi:hypothetical protein
LGALGALDHNSAITTTATTPSSNVAISTPLRRVNEAGRASGGPGSTTSPRGRSPELK